MSATVIGAIVWLPLLVALLFLWVGAKLPERIAAGAGILATAVPAVLATGLMVQYGSDLTTWKAKMPWFSIAGRSVDLGFLIRPTTLWLMLVVAWISVFVHGYAWSYMKKKSETGSRFAGFFALLGFFTAAMQSFVVSSNFLQLVISWEAIGVASFLLIGFWQKEHKARLAAIKAFLMTRIGDMGLLAALGLTWWHWGTWEIDELAQRVDVASMDGPVMWVAVLIAVAALVKAGQLPLHTWLPDAMAGPTPVSALLHAATLVVAGVYLIDQFSFFFLSGSVANSLLLWVGSLTALYAAVMACLQTDLKRLLAYSTASHLGFMFVALGLQMPGYAFLLLLSHAFFKALLFLVGGVLLSSPQSQGPWTSSTGLLLVWWLGILSMLDFAALKKGIFAEAFSQGFMVFFYLLLGAYAFTFTYALRLFMQVRRASVLTPEEKKVVLPSNSMGWGVVTLSVAVLGVQGALMGFSSPLFHWLGGRSGTSLPSHPGWMTFLGLAMWVLGAIVVIGLVWIGRGTRSWWWERVDPWDGVYRIVVIYPLKRLAQGFQCFDQFVVQGVVNLVGRVSMGLGQGAARLQQGRLECYLLIAVVTLAASLLLLLWIGG